MQTTCLKYFAKRDKTGFPIPGTEMGYEKNLSDCCLGLVELPSEQMVVGGGETQYYHPGGLRFFYRVDCETGNVLPNSLFSALKHPGGGVLEWFKIV